MGKKTAIVIIALIAIAAVAVYFAWPYIDDTVNGNKVQYNYSVEDTKTMITYKEPIGIEFAEDGKVFVIVKITERNSGLDSYLPTVSDIKVKGSDGNVYGAEMDRSIRYDPSNKDLKTLDKDKTTSFSVVYYMPEDVTIVGTEWNHSWPKGEYDKGL